MAAVKGKLSKPSSGIGDHPTRKSAGVKGFKVYMETGTAAEVYNCDSSDTRQKASIVAPGRKSVTFSESSSQAKTSNYKGGAKILHSQKAKHDNSMNGGRRALADVSNLRGNSLKTKGQNGSKQLTTSKKTLPLTRKPLLTFDTVCKVDTTASIEKVKVREDRRQVASGYPALRIGSRDIKPYAGDQRSKIQGCGSLNIDCRYRINPRNPLPPSRKSLLESKLSIQVGLHDKKAAAENVKNGTIGVHSFPIKAKIVRKVMPQVTNARAHLWKNRVSDGFILMASKSQSAVKGRPFLRKSVKPIVKTTYGMSIVKTTLKSKDKEVSTLCGSSRTSEEPHSVAEASSECNSNTTGNKLEKDATKKPRRRKSFTSLLMARSKVQDEKGQCLEQKLPSIYDDGNPNEVSEYVDEIYQYHWTMEAQSSSLENYMEMQAEITSQIRGILVNWLIEVHAKFDLMPETLYLTVTLLDRYLSLVKINKSELQLVGLTALLLASKYEDFWHPRVSDLISISVEFYTRDQMLGMEKTFLKKLKFRLNTPTPYIFMLRFLKASQSDKKLEDLSFYLIDLCMVDYEAIRFRASLLCASAIYLARCTLQITPPWSQLLCIYSRYDESQLRDCAEMVLKLQRSAKTSKLEVTYEKYSRPEYSQVANIKPLNKLPLELNFFKLPNPMIINTRK